MLQPERSARALAAALLAVLLLSLIPVVWLAFYAWPAADDFTYAAVTAHAWQQTHSLGAVFDAAWRHSMEIYQTWQGSFFAIFLMCLQPGFLGGEWYFAGVLALLFSFVLASGFLIYTVARRLLGCGRAAAATVALTLVLLSLQFTYDPVESFFWFNGGVYYTFFYSLCAVLFGLLLRAFTGSGWRAGAQYALCLPLAFVIGGGSFPPALASLLLLGLATAFFVWRKRPLAAVKAALVLAALALSFFINVLAPGNALRQAAAGSPNSPVAAILLSLVYGVYAFCNCTTLPVIAGWALLTPLLYRAVARLRFTFPLPLIFAALVYGVFSSQGTPVFYALGTSMPERVINIIYFSCFPFTLLVWAYFLGWLAHRDWWLRFLARVDLAPRAALRRAFFAVVLCVGLAGALGLVRVSKDAATGGMQLSGLPLSAQAALTLVTGEAQAYHDQLAARQALYQDEALSDVRVEPLRSRPYLLFTEDIGEDPAYWVNRSLADFYGKDTIALSDAG